MAIQYTPITYLGEQLVQRSGDHMVSVDMSEANLADRTKRIHPASLSVPNLKYMVTQVGHPFGVLSPVYFDATDGLWKGARANDRDTLCTHVVVYVDGDEFLVAEQGTFRITHGLAFGYWFLSDTIAGALVDEPGVINNPVLYAMDADTVRVLSVGEVVSPTASSIVVSAPVTPDYTAAVQGNNLQQVTNKVAGLQNPNLIVDFTVPTDVIQIIIDTDRFGNSLNIKTGERIIIIFEHTFVDDLGNPANNRCFYRINNILDRNYRIVSTDSSSFQAFHANGYIHYTVFHLIVDGNVHGFGSNHGQLANGTFFGGGMNYFSLIQEVSSINSIRAGRLDSQSSIKAGSRIKIYKV